MSLGFRRRLITLASSNMSGRAVVFIIHRFHRHFPSPIGLRWILCFSCPFLGFRGFVKSSVNSSLHWEYSNECFYLDVSNNFFKKNHILCFYKLKYLFKYKNKYLNCINFKVYRRISYLIWYQNLLLKNFKIKFKVCLYYILLEFTLLWVELVKNWIYVICSDVRIRIKRKLLVSTNNKKICKFGAIFL